MGLTYAWSAKMEQRKASPSPLLMFRTALHDTQSPFKVPDSEFLFVGAATWTILQISLHSDFFEMKPQ